MFTKSRTKLLVFCGTALGFIVGAAFGLLLFAGIAPLYSGNFMHRLGYLRQLGEVSAIVDGNFYKDVDDQSMFDNAAKAMVASLDDKYAAYYTAEEYTRIQKSQSGKYVGIGVSISIDDDGNIFVASLNEDSPAEKAGIKIGDVFFAVNGEEVAGWSTDELVGRIGGFEETSYTLSMLRGQEKLEFNIKNEEIVTHRVHFKMMERIAYIKIDEFTGDCDTGFKQAMEGARASNAGALLIDLRNNPGGDLTKVIKVAEQILPEGVVLTMKKKNGQVEERYAYGNGIDLPVVILVNSGSASASEVLAGAAQDYGVATIVGTQTFGKGIVQTVYKMLTGDGHVKLTTDVYYTPNGRSLHGEGIKPDIEVELPEDLKDVPVMSIDERDDLQLSAAKDVLYRKMDYSIK